MGRLVDDLERLQAAIEAKVRELNLDLDSTFDKQSTEYTLLRAFTYTPERILSWRRYDDTRQAGVDRPSDP